MNKIKDNQTIAYQEGYEAFFNNDLLKDNPYPKETIERKSWIDGYIAALDENPDKL